MSLITLQQYKDYTGTTDTTNDTLLNYLIPAVSAEVETYCDRKFSATQYIEWATPASCYNYYNTRQSPILYIQLVGIEDTALKITNTGSVKYTISIDNKKMYVTPSDTLTTVTYDLTAASYDTLTDLKTALEGLATLSVTVESDVNQLSITLKDDVYVIGDSDDGEIDIIGVEQVSDCYRIIDDRTIMLSNIYNSYCLVYQAGYATIPLDLQLCVSNIVKDALNVATGELSSNIVSETETNYSYSLGGNIDLHNIVANYSGVLDNYRLISL